MFNLHSSASDFDFSIVWAAPTEYVVGLGESKEAWKNAERADADFSVPDWTVFEVKR